jgi:transposase InsO family protein
MDAVGLGTNEPSTLPTQHILIFEKPWPSTAPPAGSTSSACRISPPRAPSGFLKRLLKAAPFKIYTVLTDNGKEFTDRFCATGEREPTGRHPLDRLCAEHAIEHRLIKPAHPQTNGMVERFNGRISEVLKTTRFRSGEHLEDTLQRYAALYSSIT